MNNEATEAKEKVLAFYPKAFARHWGGHLDLEDGWKIEGGPIGVSLNVAPLGCGDTELEAWIDAASRLPKEENEVCKFCTQPIGRDSGSYFHVNGSNVCWPASFKTTATPASRLPVREEPAKPKICRCSPDICKCDLGCCPCQDSEVPSPIPSATADATKCGSCAHVLPEHFDGCFYKLAIPSAGEDVKLQGPTETIFDANQRNYGQLLAALKENARLEDATVEQYNAGRQSVIGELETATRAVQDTKSFLEETCRRAEQAEATIALRDEQIAQWKVAAPIEEYHEDKGCCLWWIFPLCEPPYCGTPNDCDWPGYHTHFTRLMNDMCPEPKAEIARLKGESK